MNTQYHRGTWTGLGGLNQVYGPNRPTQTVRHIVIVVGMMLGDKMPKLSDFQYA